MIELFVSWTVAAPAQLNCQMYPLSLLLFLSLQLGFLSLSSIPPTTFASLNLLQTGNGSCPLNFGVLRQLFDASRRPNLDVTTECLYVRQTLRLVQSEYLRLTGSFLPPIDSAESCWSSYQTLVDEFVPNFNPRRSCGFETLWIAEGCMNITTRDEFESTVPRSVLNEVVLACNQSLDNGSPCITCTTRLSTLQAEYLTGGSIGNIYDCTAYPLIYAAAFANDFGPTDKGTGKCLFSLHFTPSSNNKQRNNKQLKVVVIVVVVVGGFVLFVVLGGGLFMPRRHKKLIEKRKIARNNTSTELWSGLDSITRSTTLIRFTFDEIKVATKNFSRGNIIGRGGYGNVYKGVLTDGSEVALKRFKNCSAAGDATFAHEVEVIASVRHINLVGPPEVMEKYVMLAVLCSHPQLYARPMMDQVVKILERNEPVPSIPKRPIPLIAGIDDIEKSVSSGYGHLSTFGGYQTYKFEGECHFNPKGLLNSALRFGSKPPRLGPLVDHLDGVGYVASRGPPTDHRVCRSDSGVPLHGPGSIKQFFKVKSGVTSRGPSNCEIPMVELETLINGGKELRRKMMMDPFSRPINPISRLMGKIWCTKSTENSALPKCSEQPDFNNLLTLQADSTTEECDLTFSQNMKVVDGIEIKKWPFIPEGSTRSTLIEALMTVNYFVVLSLKDYAIEAFVSCN
ncbi:hypothetical protein LguiA_029737 [Lonicera macranthoides]